MTHLGPTRRAERKALLATTSKLMAEVGWANRDLDTEVQERCEFMRWREARDSAFPAVAEAVGMKEAA